MPAGLHTVTEAAQLVPVSRSKLYRLIKAGRVPYQLMYEGIRLSDDDIAAVRDLLTQPLYVHRPAVA